MGYSNSCSCYGHDYHGRGRARSFLTKEEKVEMLKDYQDSLEKEAKGISERIAELEKNN